MHLHDHVQAVGEDENHEQGREQSHPDSRCEEAGTVAGVREIPSHVEALDLVLKRTLVNSVDPSEGKILRGVNDFRRAFQICQMLL